MTQVRQLRRTPGTALMSWVPVTDAHGRTRMEMRWHVGEAARVDRAPRTTRSAA
ncbi:MULTISPECIES: hypothetical protein [Ornithinimicrobium]|jgi:hypothetical protein|uniref:Uncharacterized protein n=1 Tax=Ornithinimicrobium kibberense TaxID=282060 RepID=A0ABV5V1U9_9MICO|nr:MULTISPECIES: hypothetical protein [Ornithinimicrobium]